MKFKPLSPLFIGSLALIIGVSFMTAKMIGVRFRTANILSSVTTGVPTPVTSLSIRADFVSYLYSCMLGRPPDQAGLDFWVGTMASDPDPVNHLYRAFYAAQDQSLSNTAFVTEMYNCVLFRNPNDPPDNNFSGRDFWANEMNLGHQTQASMLEVFLGSSEYNTGIFPKLSALPVNLPTPTPTPTPSLTPVSTPTPTPTPTPIPVNPVSISLSASSVAVSSGQAVYLSWSVANASDGTIIFNNGIGTVGTSGNRVVNPTTTTTYTLSGSNSLGTVSRSITVTIVSVAPSVSISSPQPGESWTVGTTHPIVWTSNQSSSTTVMILLSGNTVTSNAPNTNLYNWTIPSNFIPGQYALTISVNGTIATGQSGVFSIVSAPTTTPTPSLTPVSTPTPTPTPTPIPTPTPTPVPTPTPSITPTPTPTIVPTPIPTPTPVPTPTPTTGPAGYTFCVFENQSCNFSGMKSVAYGANNHFNYLTLTGGTSCSNTIFGDSIVGIVKACYIKDAVIPTPSFTPTPTPTPTPSSSFTPSPTPTPTPTPPPPPTPTPTPTPTPGIGPAGYVLCASENQSCTFSGTKNVAYGANGQFNYLTLTGGTGCSNTVFGDSIVGVVKSCYTKDAVTPTATPTPSAIPTPTPTPTVTIIFPTKTDDFVNHLYSCVLGRTALASQDDPSGFTFWKNVFTTNGDVGQLYHAFYESLDFSRRNLSNSDFVTNLYNCTLFRNPNGVGFSNWLNALNTGTTNRKEILDPGFLQSWEFLNLVSPKLLALRPVVFVQTNLDSRLAVTHVAGFYPNFGADFMVKGAQDARNLGFRGIELYMAPEMCGPIKDKDGNFLKNAYQTPQTQDWCDPRPGPANISLDYHSLAELAAHPRYRAVFNMNFQNYFITTETINPDRGMGAETGDCTADELFRINAFNVGADCYKNGFSQNQLNSLRNDFKSLFVYLLQTYAGTNKTFVIMSGNELENHYKADGTFPDWAKNNLVTYLNTISDALVKAKALVAPVGVKVYHGCEFASVNSDPNGSFATRDYVINSGINYVVPKTHCDLYGWSAWDYPVNHTNDDNYMTKALDYYASRAPDSPDFGNYNVFPSEYGLSEHYGSWSSGKVSGILNNGIDRAFAWGVPYLNYWALYDNECRTDGVPVFPVTNEIQCNGNWIRKPAADASQLGPLSETYNRVFLPRK